MLFLILIGSYLMKNKKKLETVNIDEKMFINSTNDEILIKDD